MEYILTTVVYDCISEDMKVPACTPVSELIEALNEIIGKTGQTLHANPKGIILDTSKTLAQQGIEHGAILTLI